MKPLSIFEQLNGPTKKPEPTNKPFVDADALFALIDAMPVPYSTLLVTDELRSVDILAAQLAVNSPAPAHLLRQKLSNLTTISFDVMTRRYLRKEWQTACCAPIEKSINAPLK